MGLSDFWQAHFFLVFKASCGTVLVIFFHIDTGFFTNT